MGSSKSPLPCCHGEGGGTAFVASVRVVGIPWGGCSLFLPPICSPPVLLLPSAAIRAPILVGRRKGATKSDEGFPFSAWEGGGRRRGTTLNHSTQALPAARMGRNSFFPFKFRSKTPSPVRPGHRCG